jgi:hypothetical protein
MRFSFQWGYVNFVQCVYVCVCLYIYTHTLSYGLTVKTT